MVCHRCQVEAVKFGINGQGYQRFLCRQRGKTFSDIPARPLDDLRVDPEKAFKVIGMLAEGMGVRACERLARLNRRTVLGILETAGQKCARLLDSRLVNLNLQEVQVDEIYAFVRCLQQNTDPENQIHGEQYTFLAVDKPSKLIAHWFVGKRTKRNAVEFLRGFKRRINARIQLTSDAWNGYRANLGAVFQVFREGVDYGTEMNYFARTPGLGPDRRENPVVLQWVKREVEIGYPDPGKITTAHVERTNLSVRLFNRRFTRKTIGFSKKLRNHKLSVALLVAHFNFCRVHSAHGMTPAMAAGLTDHVWTVEELLSASS